MEENGQSYFEENEHKISTHISFLEENGYCHKVDLPQVYICHYSDSYILSNKNLYWFLKCFCRPLTEIWPKILINFILP